jgi:hypothetical protein
LSSRVTDWGGVMELPDRGVMRAPHRPTVTPQLHSAHPSHGGNIRGTSASTNLTPWVGSMSTSTSTDSLRARPGSYFILFHCHTPELASPKPRLSRDLQLRAKCRYIIYGTEKGYIKSTASIARNKSPLEKEENAGHDARTP